MRGAGTLPSSPFEELHRDAQTRARAGTLATAHGRIETPVFMPVATQGSVKALSQQVLRDIKVTAILANTYHLYLRPGLEILKKAGGLHRFMNWDKTILTDSGGYQIFSLSHLRKIEAGGVTFKSHHDGSLHHLTPEKVIELQAGLGSDIWTCLDICPPFPCEAKAARSALETTQLWAERSWRAYEKLEKPALLFGILQGSFYPDLRREAAEHLLRHPFQGIALGGFSVGEPKEKTWEILEATLKELPSEKPVYLMGVGTPEDLWEAVGMGVDMFDCVWPTRNARNGQVMTSQGKLYIKNLQFRDDFGPLDPECGCEACRNYSRAYLSHLFRSRELLAHEILSLHNVHFLIELMRQIASSVRENRFLEAKKRFLTKWRSHVP